MTRSRTPTEAGPRGLVNLPAVLFVLAAVAVAAAPARGQVPCEIHRLDPPEQGFYSKRAAVRGLPILAHADVSDAAIEEAARRIDRLIGRSEGIADNIRRLGVRMCVIGKDQQTSDLPMYRHMKGKLVDGKQTFDQRGRGYGGLYASCAEENLLLLPSDRFRDHRDICSHEFAHTILAYGLCREVRDKVEQQWKKSIAAGKWKTMYAAGNAHEFFAELTMWYLGSRGDYGKAEPPPSIGAGWLRSYDPDAYELLDSIYSGRLAPGRIDVTDLPALPAEREGQVRSQDNQPSTEVFFHNQTDQPVHLWWLDQQGKRRDYGEVAPGDVKSQSTFATHAWLLVRQDGTVLGIYVADRTIGRIVIRTGGPAGTAPTSGPASASRPAAQPAC
jgi:hypothetical protein